MNVDQNAVLNNLAASLAAVQSALDTIQGIVSSWNQPGAPIVKAALEVSVAALQAQKDALSALLASDSEIAILS